MSFNDILKDSFLNGFNSTEIGIKEILLVLFVTFLISTYIFFCYRLLTRRAFYSKAFNLSLILVSLITASIILTIQTSVVVSLGMVGALSIVRFRTAVKEPMDLAFLFWAISTGIMCGAGKYDIAIALSIVITFALYIFDKIPIARTSKILVIKYHNTVESARIVSCLEKHSKHFIEKSKSINDGTVDVVYELRTNSDSIITEELSKISGVKSVSLLKHDGEVTF